MPRPAATIDTSCLIPIESLGLLPKLSLLFERVWIPKRVREETAKRHSQKRAIASALRRYAFCKRCQVVDVARVELLLSGSRARPRKPKRHRGEAEAVIQATERGATSVLADDPDGRRWARGHGLDCHGTLWVLSELRRIGVVGPLRPMIQRLQRQGVRLPKTEVEQILREFGEA